MSKTKQKGSSGTVQRGLPQSVSAGRGGALSIVREVVRSAESERGEWFNATIASGSTVAIATGILRAIGWQAVSAPADDGRLLAVMCPEDWPQADAAVDDSGGGEDEEEEEPATGKRGRDFPASL